MTSKILLKVENLQIQRQGRPVGGAFSFAVHAGALCCIVGPNGAGKTTLLRSIAGLIPVSGIQRSDSFCFVGNSDFQSRQMTVRETLAFWASFCGANFERAMESFKLDSLLPKRMDQLSQGERQRISLARLLCGHFDLWILDEPFANLDKEFSTRLEKIMKAHCWKGGGILFSEHRKEGSAFATLTLPMNALKV